MNTPISEKIRKSLVPLRYPDGPIAKNSRTEYTYLTTLIPDFNSDVYNAVLFDLDVRPSIGCDSNRCLLYSIPQIGEFCLQFCLPVNASRSAFQVNGYILSAQTDLQCGVWYDLFECPVNLFSASYGDRFLNVDYSADGPRTVTFRYLSTDEKTRQSAIAASRT